MSEIVAGRKDQINKHSSEWLIIDIGMSMYSDSTGRSCGVWNGPRTLDVITFNKLLELVIEKVEDGCPRSLNC